MRTITVILDEFDEEYSICEWVQQTQTVQFRDYGFNEVKNEEELFAMREELYNILFER